MPVQYNSQKIIPAPQIQIEKEFLRTGEGVIIGSNFNISVFGKLLATKGSPDSTGTFWTNSGYPADEIIPDDQMLKSLLRKQEALRQLFAQEGHSFEVQPLDGSMPIKFFPRILKLTFPQGNWYNESEYTIEMQADFIEGYINPSGEDSFSSYIMDASESWNIEFNDEPENEYQHNTFRLTHSLSAVGKRHYEEGQPTLEAWQQAQAWVLPKLGLDMDRILSSGVLNLPGYMSGYNQVRSETVDKKGGTYAVNESWLIASGSALEDFSVSTNISIDDGLSHVTIEGQIIGLETRDTNFNITQSKYDSASTKFSSLVSNSILSRAQNYSTVTLNTTPVSEAVSRNPVAGTIRYSYEYNNRPSKYFTTASRELITVNDRNPTDVFAAIPILGRANGPLLQDIGTKTEAVRSLTIELVMPVPSGNSFSVWLAASPNTDALLVDAKPVASRVFKSQDDVTWIPQEGRYTRQVAWTWGN